MNIQLEFYINALHIPQSELANNGLFIKGVTFQDRVTGAADQLDIEILDPESKWKKGLLPDKNDEFQIVIKGDGEQKLTTPSFWIDKVEWNDTAGDISTCHMGGLSLLYEKKSNIRKRRSAYYENTTLRTVVSGIAQRNGFTLTWFGTDIQLPPMEQTRESDYSFLQRLAKEQGSFVKFIKKKMIFATPTDDIAFGSDGNEVTGNTGSGSRFVEIKIEDLSNRQFMLQANNKTKQTWETLDVFNKHLNRTVGKFSEDLDLGPISANALKTGREKGAQGTVSYAILGDLSAKFTYFVTPDGPRAGELLGGTVIYFTDAGKLVGTYRIKDVAQSLTPTNGWVINGDLERITSREIATPTTRQRNNRRLNKNKSLSKGDVIGIRTGQDPFKKDLERQEKQKHIDGSRIKNDSLYGAATPGIQGD